MSELERRLQELGGEIAYPATPRFDLGFDRRRAGAGRLRPLALGFAILLAALAGVLAFSPGARSAFLEIFHIRGATVERSRRLPDVAAQRVDFGERVGREEAERRAGFRLLDLGERAGRDLRPAGRPCVSVGLRRSGAATARALAGARRDLRRVHQEDRQPRNDDRRGDGRGEPGLFVDGADHFVMFLDENGLISDEATYLAGTVLLWNRGDAAPATRGRSDARRGARARQVGRVAEPAWVTGVSRRKPERRSA